jgi:hypothetical protein
MAVHSLAPSDLIENQSYSADDQLVWLPAGFNLEQFDHGVFVTRPQDKSVGAEVEVAQ